MKNILKKLRNGLIVSCQAQGKSPFNSPEGVTMFAKAAAMGGAAGICAEGIAKTRKIIMSVHVPVIGMVKSTFSDGSLKITGSFKDVEDLLAIDCDIIAVDGTFRQRQKMGGPEFIAEIKRHYSCTILACVASAREGAACVAAGTDCLSTALSGYTAETAVKTGDGPDFALVKKLAGKCNVPVFAEGRIRTPLEATKAIEMGAWAVVVGSAITRPEDITAWFLAAIHKNLSG